MRTPRLAALAVFATGLAALGAAVLTAARPAAAAAGTALPAHLYAPYFETWTSDSITTTA